MLVGAAPTGALHMVSGHLCKICFEREINTARDRRLSPALGSMAWQVIQNSLVSKRERHGTIYDLWKTCVARLLWDEWDPIFVQVGLKRLIW